jgi:hypothetical protein
MDNFKNKLQKSLTEVRHNERTRQSAATFARQGAKLHSKFRNCYTMPEYLIGDSGSIGWFANKSNSAYGWYLYPLTDEDKKWLKENGVDTKNVFGSKSENTGTNNIVKLYPETGKVAFFDNEYYEKTDEVRFQKPTFYTVLVISPKLDKRLR